MMTPRQIEHLRYVWACSQASFHNAHFSQEDGVVFLPDDFMYEGAREMRKANALRDKHDVMMANRRIEAMKSGDKSGVPTWAIEARVN